MEEIKIQVDLETYVTILEARKEQIENNFGWTIPPIVWNFFLDMLRDGYVPSDTNPSVVVDNIAINKDYGYIEDYINGERTEEVVRKDAEKKALAYFPDENYVIWSL